MKTFKVNADYESVLFRGQIGSPALIHSLEFLYFFLETDALLTDKNYSEDYLDYVEQISGHKPCLVKKASSISNWWGECKDLEKERWWNSKITSAEFLLTKGWIKDLYILKNENDLSQLNSLKKYLFKDPFLMSGQKFQTNKENLVWNKEKILIVEPLLKRLYDFSTYIFPDRKMIVYENLVDERFQYKGSYFNHIHSATLQKLSFYPQINHALWDQFQNQLLEIIAFYSSKENRMGYSVDSFVFEDDGIKLYPLCEVNYRRTMGRIAYELGLKYGGNKSWIGFFLLKTGNEPLWKKIKNLVPQFSQQSGVLVLSPGDTRFEILLVRAENKEEARELLSHAETAIDF
jgi:hypothetical protein